MLNRIGRYLVDVSKIVYIDFTESSEILVVFDNDVQLNIDDEDDIRSWQSFRGMIPPPQPLTTTEKS